MAGELPNSQNRETNKFHHSLTEKKVVNKTTEQEVKSLKESLPWHKSLKEILDTPEMFKFRLNELNFSLNIIEKITGRELANRVEGVWSQRIGKFDIYFNRALYLLQWLENSRLDFSKNPDLYNEYIKAMNKYLTLSKKLY